MSLRPWVDAVDGSVPIDLSDGPDGSTVVDCTADVHIQGRSASVGVRIIEGTSRKLIGHTYDCMRSRMEA